MTAVFKASDTVFTEHFHGTFDHVYLLEQTLPYGLTEKKGQIAISPEGRILGWRFKGEEKFECWRKEGDLSVCLRTAEDSSGGYTALTGMTVPYTNRSWTITHFYRSGDCCTPDDDKAVQYASFAEAIAQLQGYEWENVEILKADEAYQS